MNKGLIYVYAAVCGALLLSACETTNQEYSGSRVVDVKQNSSGAYRAPAQGVQVIDARQQGSGDNYYVAPPAGVQNTYADSSSATQNTYAPPPPPPQNSQVSGPEQYRVVKGDTLYSIAFRYGLDYRDLARQNGIAPPYNITVGQVLNLNLKQSAAPVYIVKQGDTLYSIARNNGQSVAFLAGVNDLEPPYSLNAGQKLYLARPDNTSAAPTSVSQAAVPVAGKTAEPPQPAPKPAASTAASTTASTAATTAPKPAPAAAEPPKAADTPVVKGKTRKEGGVTWAWPAQGKIIKSFSTAEQGNKGIDISGSRGQRVLSAADGQVVYAGNALSGYGNLVIINHANEYLSAYAHNEKLLVSEGQQVKRGQQIATMGSTDAASVRLHFEIRYRGQSVNPVSYLPK